MAARMAATADLFEIGTVTIISSPFIVVAKDIVGFLDELKSILCLIPRVLVGMILQRQFTVRFSDLVFRCVSLDAKYLIKVFCHGKYDLERSVR